MKARNPKEQTKKYKRKKKKKIKRGTLFLLIIMLGYLVYHYVYLEIQYQSLLREKETLRAEVKTTQDYQRQLVEEIEKADSDEYIETLARKYFGLVYPDEKVYIEKEVESTDEEE